MTDENAGYTTGIKTRIKNNTSTFGYAVEWMEWDSEFRNTDLQFGDIIIGVNDKMYSEDEKNIENTRAIGNYLEATFFEETGWNVKEPVTLHIVRDYKKADIVGNLRRPAIYFNKEQRRILGDSGPDRLANDGFSTAWASWYERLVQHLKLYIDDKRWERSSIDNRMKLAEHLEWKERVDFLCNKYPCSFSKTVLGDWQLVKEILEGTQYNDITEVALEYREIGAKRVNMVKEASHKAKEIFVDKIKPDTIIPFPAINPVYGDIELAVGKKIILPIITFENFINDLGKTFAVIGNIKDGFYFVHLNSPEMDLFFRTLFYYKAQVTPDVPEKYEFTVEVLNEPAMLTYYGKAIMGIMVKTVAGMAGDKHVFIDLTLLSKNGKVIFSGEEDLSLFSAPDIAETADPRQVIEAMIHYIKVGDMKAWKKLFATWQIYTDWDGPPYMDMAYWMPDESYQNAWEKSRRLVLKDVYDARVIHVSPAKVVVKEKPATGIPQVEQVKVIIDHIGYFDGEYRSFSSLYVHRQWILQRLDNGPWKIKELQGL